MQSSNYLVTPFFFLSLSLTVFSLSWKSTWTLWKPEGKSFFIMFNYFHMFLLLWQLSLCLYVCVCLSVCILNTPASFWPQEPQQTNAIKINIKIIMSGKVSRKSKQHLQTFIMRNTICFCFSFSFSFFVRWGFLTQIRIQALTFGWQQEEEAKAKKGTSQVEQKRHSKVVLMKCSRGKSLKLTI